MTPEEKAKELIGKFTNEISGDCENGCNSVSHHNAKKCALIAVEEVLKFTIHERSELYYNFKNYWQEVKQSIEKQ